ncbi:AMIN-like domain-containing (lipo)protein [Amycolatopsis lexingtonensis]|uniref:AMIN-like domain-containing (lipo)protein n=1 Tax=Amycolatopsis lexingtonensis TaxID=218822 RepID=UPI003F6FEA92
MRGRVLAAALGCGLVLAGCGADPGASPSTGTPLSDSALPAPAPTAPAKPASSSTAPVCAETSGWRADPRLSDTMSREALHLVRAGRHACFDRVVFDVNGPAETGYAVQYVPVVASDPKGDPLPVPGGAALEIVVRAPALGSDDTGHQPGRVLAAVGDTLVTTPDWPSLRAVRFAGSFEGQSTFAAGVRAKLPFRVFTQTAPQDRVRRVVVDIAH